MLSEKQIRELQAMNPLQNVNLRPVTKTVPLQVGPTRDPDGGTAYHSGRFRCNTGASEKWASLERLAGLQPGQSGAYFEADADVKVVTVRPVFGVGEGIMPVRLGTDGLVTVYLNGVYEEHSSLRPRSQQDVTVSIGTDSTGNACLVIQLQIALPKRRTAKTRTAKAAPRPDAEIDPEVDDEMEEPTP